MSRIVIRTEEVYRLSQQMRDVARELEALIRSLDGALPATGWSGHHRDRAEGEWRSAQNSLAGLSHRSNSLAGLLERAAAAFEEADANAVRAMAAARGALAAIPPGLLTPRRAGPLGAAGGGAGDFGLGKGTAHGFNAANASSADPIDLRTGHYIYTHADLSLPPGEPFLLQRVYSSRPPGGWGFSWQYRLDFGHPEEVVLLIGEGVIGRATFRREGERFVSTVPGFSLRQEDEGFLLRDPEGTEIRFNSQGLPLLWRDSIGRSVRFEYPAPHTLRLTAPWGTPWATLRLDEQGRVLAVEDDQGHSLHYRYDEAGRLVAFTDREGHTTRYEYDAHGFLTRIVGPDGTLLLENEYDAEGRVLAQKDAMENVTRLEYTLAPDWPCPIKGVTVTYPDGLQARYTLSQGEVVHCEIAGAEVRFAYDERGFPVEIQDPEGGIWRIGWDEDGRLTAFTSPLGQTFLWEYDAAGRLMRQTFPDGTRAEIVYDRQGRPVTLVGPGGEKIRLEYDERGLPKALVDPLGQRLELEYDERGRETAVTFPDGQKTTWSYDDKENQVTLRDPLGRAVLYRYDREGRLVGLQRGPERLRLTYTPYGEPTRLEDEAGRSIGIEYDPNGQPLRLRFPNGYTLSQTYDVRGRPVELRDGRGRVLFRQAYDAWGRLTALTDPLGRSWTYTYDGVGNLRALTDRKGNTLRFEYDQAYRLVRAWDAEGRLVLQVEYDEMDRPRRFIDAEGHRMEFSFSPDDSLTAVSIDGKAARAELDAAGRVVRLVDENGRARTYEYDALGNLVRETYPLGQTYAYAYDPVGRLQERTMPDGTRIHFQYDDLDRLTQVRYARDGREQVAVLDYGPDGRSLTLRDERGAVVYSLRPENILERQDPLGRTVRYEFSEAGEIRRVVYPDGRSVEYEHDPNGNLVRIRDFAGRETRLEYDENDQPVAVHHPNGWVTRWEYDPMGRVVAIRHLDPSGAVMLEQRMVRDGTGRVVETTVDGPIAARVPQGPDILARRRFTFNELDQIVASDEGPFRYDPNGNLTSYPDDGLSVSLTYDLADRLAEARVGSEHFVYHYDAEGNRLGVTHNGQTRYYVLDTVLDLPRPLMELDEAGNPLRYYIWGDGLQYAVDPEGHLEIYLFNHRGDTLAVVDEGGNVVAAYAYAPYGQVLGRYGERDVPFRFLGRHGVIADHDRLYFIRARYYAPTLGRFLQPDRLPVRIPLPGFLNRYAYALDDPWNLVDIDGLIPLILAGALIGGAIGGGVEIFKQVVIEKKPLREIEWRSVAAAAIGGAVGGLISATGIGAIPVLGSAIGGAAAGGVQQILDNVFHNRPWHQGVVQAVGEGAIWGIAAWGLSTAIRVGVAGVQAARHGQSATQAIGKAWSRSLTDPWRQTLKDPRAIGRLSKPMAKVTREMWRALKRDAVASVTTDLTRVSFFEPRKAM
ncbi:MAG: RHS repeat-associated core domain-containing protein [Anaerolineae bacterium]|nr:DUF6531 domain-containing protein [Anaerolineae bacterium]MDW7991849.1 RHS repeat-associated core domain-containing protein [Anaerolineae bacterium]